MAIHLTEQQSQAIEAQQGGPIEVVDPATKQLYFLIAVEAFGHIGELPAESAAQVSPESASEIPPGILRSQQAFWRELPVLLREKKNHRQWAAYHGDERIGMAPTKTELIREIGRRKVPRDDYYIGRIRPQALAPWETVEVEPIHPRHQDAFPPET